MAIQIRSLSKITSSDFGLISFNKSQEIYGNSSSKRTSSDFGLILFNKNLSRFRSQLFVVKHLDRERLVLHLLAGLQGVLPVLAKRTYS